MTKVKINCSQCGATGLYQGMCEPEETAVVCLGCEGNGYKEVEAFSGLREKRGIKWVQKSKGSFILSCGPTGNSISYQDFKNGKRP